MIVIQSDVIYLHKGDDASFTVGLEIDGQPYEMQTGDSLKLTVREEPTSGSTALLTVTSTTNTIKITHTQSTNLAVGSYSADIQLTQANGDITTLWPLLEVRKRAKEENFKNFVVMAEVSA